MLSGGLKASRIRSRHESASIPVPATSIVSLAGLDLLTIFALN
jgi:hypothetical protein